MTPRRKRFLALAAVGAALAISLSPGHPIDVDDYPRPAGFQRDPRLAHPEKLPPVAFAILKTAESKSLEALFYDGGSWLEPRIGSHAAILVKHPKAAFLFDTGLGVQVDAQFADMPFWLRPLMAYDKNAAAREQLAAHRQDVQHVFLSHLHWDHASGIEDFPHAKTWTTRAELEWARKVTPGDPGYIRSQFDDERIQWRYLEFADAPYENFPQSLDFFNDGSVVFVPLPGHTPGAVGLFVNLRSGQRYFFTGDTTWTLEGFQRPADKFWFSSAIVDQDKRKTRETIVQVHRLMREYPKLNVIPAHDQHVHERIGFFPAFVR